MRETRVEILVEGQRMVGALHLPDLARNEAAPCVIASHGLLSNKSGAKYLRMGVTFSSQGMAFFRFDHRGALAGESEGKLEETTLTKRTEDLKSAIDCLSRLKEIDSNRLGLIGSSLGGVVVLLTKDKRTKARVVLATPFQFRPPSPEAEAAFREKGYHQYPTGLRIRRDFYEDSRKYDLKREVEDLNCPLLIIHGQLDEQVSVHDAQLLYQAASEPKELRIIEGADHSFTDSDKLDMALDLSVEWFNRYL